MSTLIHGFSLAQEEGREPLATLQTKSHRLYQPVDFYGAIWNQYVR